MHAAPATSDVWTRRTTLVWRRVGDEGVILDPDGRMMRGVNLTAFAVWELLDGKRSVGEVAAAIAANYAIPLETATADVIGFVSRLQDAQLVERSG